MFLTDQQDPKEISSPVSKDGAHNGGISHADLEAMGNKIKQHEDNLKFIKSEKNKLDESLLDLQVRMSKLHSSPTPRSENIDANLQGEDINEQILRHDKSAAGVLGLVETRHGTQASQLMLTKGVVGIIAKLGKVFDENLGKVLSEYLGTKTMLAVVCKNLDTVKALETYDNQGNIDRNDGLHGLGSSIGKTIEGHFDAISLENLRPYVGQQITDDPQRRLDLLKPKLPNGELPPGFLGFAVNMIHIDPAYLRCVTSYGYGLRETLFFSLFSHLQVYKTRVDLINALPCIRDGAISLDGGIIRTPGVFTLGSKDEANVRFAKPTSSRAEDNFSETEKQMKELRWRKEKLLEDLKREQVLRDHAVLNFSKKKEEFVQFLAQSSSTNQTAPGTSGQGQERRMLPRRTCKEKNKVVATPSSSPPEDEELTTAPWPRQDGVPFTEGLSFLDGPNVTLTELRRVKQFRDRKPNESWHVSNSVYYNGLLRINLRPTRVICKSTLRAMGILSDVTTMLKRMGLGTLPYKSYPLYPELVRQFLASVELHTRDGGYDDAQEAYITYSSRGVLHELSILDLCAIYGFDATKTGCHYPKGFGRFLWPAIANNTQLSKECKLSRIRNPVIRVVAKILGNVFLGKEEVGAVTAAELVLIHYGLPRSIDTIYPSDILCNIPPTLETNLGYKFAEMLVARKLRGLNIPRTKDDFIGNLLTPIFQKNGIDLRRETVVDTPGLFDEQYFKCTHILKRDCRTYEYRDRDGVVRFTKLPVPDLTSPDTPESLSFEVSEHLQCAPPITVPTRR